MSIICDFHLHYYPCYNINLYFENIFAKLSKLKDNLGDNCSFCAVLAEREDCNFYSDLRNSEINLANCYQINLEANFIRIKCQNIELLLFPGFQFNTSEKIELLGLFSESRVPSRLSLLESLNQLQKSNALPVVNWAPGKWLFKRGKIISQLIQNKQSLVIGDTSLRPNLYPQPLLFKKALNQSWGIIHGSDPLPNPSEVNLPFEYYSFFKEDLDTNNPREQLIKLVMQQSAIARGRRNSLFKLIKRMRDLNAGPHKH